MTRLASWSLLCALALAPWVGVGLVHVVTGRALGAGVQPAYVPMLLMVFATVVAARRSAFASSRFWWLAALLAWIAVTITFLWTRDVVGLAGDAPWSKGLKQAVLLAFFAASAGAAGWTARRTGIDALERAVTLGLLLATIAALVQTIGFHLGVAGPGWLDRLTSSNPSIAAGSGELYLGDRFVGIPRARGPFPEPLLFGSYLIAAVPVAVAGAARRRGFARGWRVLTAGLGILFLLLTFSRGAWLGAVVTVVLVGWGMGRGRIPRPRLRTAVLTAAIGLAVGLLAWPVLTGSGVSELGSVLGQRVEQTSVGHDMSNRTRFWSWGVAADLFRERPVAGVGFGGFGFWYFERAPEGGDAAHFGWPVVNSLPLQLAAETGVVGLLLVLGLLLPVGRAILAGPRVDVRAVLLAAAMAGVVAHGLTFSQWDLPHLWLLAGVAVAFAADRRELV